MTDPSPTTEAINLTEARRLAGGNAGHLAGAMMERMADEIERLRAGLTRLAIAEPLAQSRFVTVEERARMNYAVAVLQGTKP